MAFCDIEEVKSQKTQPGVEERTLISPEKTSSKRISVKHIIIETDKKILPQEATEELIYFVISGRGTLIVNKVNADWDFPIESNTVVWIPYAMKYSISNLGEDNLRCLVFSSKLDQKRPGWTEIIDQAPPVRDHTLAISLSSYRFFGEYETMKQRGAESFTLCGSAIMPPDSSLAPHIPLFGAEEVMYVIRGRGKMTSGEKEFQVKAGSIVYAPPNTMHGAQNTGKDILQFIYCECVP